MFGTIELITINASLNATVKQIEEAMSRCKYQYAEDVLARQRKDVLEVKEKVNKYIVEHTKKELEELQNEDLLESV